MRKNKISKIALLAGLLIINTNTKGFYQCVPKDDWFRKRFDLMKQQDKTTFKNKLDTARKQIDDEAVWRFVAENQISGVLDAGLYKVIVAGGAGGHGGDAGIMNDYGYGYGGLGEIKTDVFHIDKNTIFYACIGSRGESASYVWHYAGAGGAGGAGSAFILSNNNFRIYVSGGGGGGGDSGGEQSSGGGGGGYGCAKGGCGGKISFNSGDYVVCKTYFSVSNGLEVSFVGSIEGKTPHTNGVGGFGGQRCADGGDGVANSKLNGENGGSCASPGNGNPGDGYVKIYKYIGNILF